MQSFLYQDTLAREEEEEGAVATVAAAAGEEEEEDAEVREATVKAGPSAPEAGSAITYTCRRRSGTTTVSLFS